MLGEAWPEMGVPWRGEDFQGQANFPLLLKFIFPKDKLSIQVHPDDAYAARHERAAGGRGKTEMWHIVSAEPGARLLAGLKPGVTREKFKAALAERRLEELFQMHEVNAGDTFFIPAGTPHTIGPGMVVCEVQEYSDLTYRVYDYGRVDSQGQPRELHIEKALEVINFNSSEGGKVMPRQMEVNITGGRRTGKVADDGAENRRVKLRETLVDCAYFEAKRIQIDQPFHLKSIRQTPRQFQLWVVLEGEGRVDWSCHPHDFTRTNDGHFSYKAGECWFIPAVFGSHGFFVKQRSTVLMATPRNPGLASPKSADAS
jgi:mannose-6-phosphate isomerase